MSPRATPFAIKGFIIVCIVLAAVAESPWHNSNCAENRVAIVHLFEWKWTDVAAECERFLGPKGFCGVQVSPPHEHVMVTTDAMRPWWERYQPVSYKIASRSGNEEEFTDMVQRCNRVNVRIYVDTLLNHMAGLGRSGTGSGGSQFNSDNFEFPGVPYTRNNFNGPQGKCNSGSGNIENYGDAEQVRNCRLSNLVDLDQSQPFVREKLAGYLNKLITIGVAGFRIDAGKHVWPADIESIISSLDNLNTDYFPASQKAFFYHEVIDMNNEPIKGQQYTHLGRVTEFRYCTKIREKIFYNSIADLRSVYDPNWNMLPPKDAFIFVDNHDNQRGHGAAGNVLTFRDPQNYKKGQAFTLANDYGYPRIMSSYQFETDKDGPPHNPDYTTKDVVINKDGSCGNGWVCEHRWSAISGMVGFAKAVQGTNVQNEWSQGNNLGFSRGSKGFFVISGDSNIDTTIATGLTAGQYCEVISGSVVEVGNDGKAHVTIKNSNEPLWAIHIEALAVNGACGDQPAQTTLPPGESTTSPAERQTTLPSGGSTTSPADRQTTKPTTVSSTTEAPRERSSNYHQSNCFEGREAIVHLFEWKFSDVAKECEQFLGPKGYCGVQVSPPHENAVITTDAMRPWWERYQPVSYKIGSRSGNEDDFKNMVQRCHNVNVHIYPDVLLNHMAGGGREGLGTAGTYFKSDDFNFPGVPYTRNNFNGPQGKCPSDSGIIDNWDDPNVVHNCSLNGLTDLDQRQEYVRGKMVEYLNHYIELGVAGFRVDASKHMWPLDIQVIQDRLNNLRTDWFPSNSRPFMIQEVIDMNSNPNIRGQHYAHLGRVTEFRYCSKIREKVDDLPGIRGVYEPGWFMLPPEDAFVFVDNHDNQRGHGAGGPVLTYRDPRRYKMGQAFTLAYTYGYPRVMSSYEFGKDTAQGPPHNDDWSTKDVECFNGEWICEHRWRAIAAMAGFRKAVSGTGVKNWWSEGNAMAFSRGNKGFLAMTNEGGMDKNIYCGLPAGQYCNVITGDPTSNGCEGETVTVDNSGNVQVRITNGDEPIFAIHVEARSGGGSDRTPPVYTTTTTQLPPKSTGTEGTTAPGSTTTRGPSDVRKTVLYVKKQTQPGEDLFVRGGIDHSRREGCTDDAKTSACAITITNNQLGTADHYDRHNAWRVGDTKLDWYGEEQGQGRYNNWQAHGSPAAWTTNDASHPAFQPDNSMGEHSWKIEMTMDCSQTENGWFELKAYLTNVGYESDITQDKTCTGTAGGSSPFVSSNHHARCGYINSFVWGENGCVINNFK